MLTLIQFPWSPFCITVLWIWNNTASCFACAISPFMNEVPLSEPRTGIDIQSLWRDWKLSLQWENEVAQSETPAPLASCHEQASLVRFYFVEASSGNFSESSASVT